MTSPRSDCSRDVDGARGLCDRCMPISNAVDNSGDCLRDRFRFAGPQRITHAREAEGVGHVRDLIARVELGLASDTVGEAEGIAAVGGARLNQIQNATHIHDQPHPNSRCPTKPEFAGVAAPL